MPEAEIQIDAHGMMVGEARLGTDDGLGERARDADALRVEGEEGGEGEAVLVRHKRADAVRELFGQHRHDLVHEVDRGRAPVRLAVERAAGRDEVRDVRDVDAQDAVARLVRLKGERVVVVTRIHRVDRDNCIVCAVEALHADWLQPVGLRLVLVPERVPLMVSFEREHAEFRYDVPERDGDEPLYLLVPVDKELQSGALNPSDGHEVLPDLSGGQGDEPGQDGSPGEVDDLPRLGGVRQLLVGLGEALERGLHLPLGQGAELGPLDGAHVGADLLDRLHADELSLAIVVGRDDDLVRLRRELSDRVEDRLDLDRLDLGRMDQLCRVGGAPIVVFGRVVELYDVAAEGYDIVFVASGLEGYHRHSSRGGGLRCAVG